MKIVFSFLLSLVTLFCYSQDSSRYTQSEIIYGRKDGMALTMIKLSPKEHANGKGIISVISGNWNSSYARALLAIGRAPVFINAGYTVLLVIHGSQPRYTIAEQLEDIKRAVRFIRFHAAEYGIDPGHIGITGASSGGNLSLLTALTDDRPDNRSRDSVDKVSSRVQAAAVFFPPTDFLNWGGSNTGLRKDLLARTGVAGAFDFKKLNPATGIYEAIPVDKLDSVVKAISPIYSVSADDPPVLIIHGDADVIVPLQQSQSLIGRLNENKVPNQLIVKAGGGHGWRNPEEEEKKIMEWFDKYLH